MRKIAILASLFILAIIIQANAQTTFPIQASLVWDIQPVQSDPTQIITKYVVILDGISTDVDPSTACSMATGLCTYRFMILNDNQHSISVASYNMWGNSGPVAINFTPKIPGKSGNIKIKVP